MKAISHMAYLHCIYVFKDWSPTVLATSLTHVYSRQSKRIVAGATLTHVRLGWSCFLTTITGRYCDRC